MTFSEFKQLIVEYVKNSFNLYYDEEQIILDDGGVKLGNHQTDLKFVLPPISEKIEKILVHIPAFQENKNHQTIFSYKTIRKSGYKILNKQNDYQSEIFFLNHSNSNSWLWVILIGLVSTIFIFKKYTISPKEFN